MTLNEDVAKEIIKHGEELRHLHTMSFKYNDFRLECIYENKKVSTATIVDNTGRYEFLTTAERESVSEEIAKYLGDEEEVSRYE